MSTPEPNATETAESPAEAPAESAAPEPVQNRASRRAKPVKQAKPAHVGPRQGSRGKS